MSHYPFNRQWYIDRREGYVNNRRNLLSQERPIPTDIQDQINAALRMYDKHIADCNTAIDYFDHEHKKKGANHLINALADANVQYSLAHGKRPFSSVAEIRNFVSFLMDDVLEDNGIELNIVGE